MRMQIFIHLILSLFLDLSKKKYVKIFRVKNINIYPR